MLTEEEIENLKEQVLNQIEKNFPEDKKDYAKEQISLMNQEEFEKFLRNNNIIKEDGEIEEGQEKEKCIFCSIISKEMNSYVVGENEKALAVLEINPISKAHVLIIPKSHDSDLKEKETKALEEEIKKKISSIFNPKKIEIASSQLFGHKVINILPVYEDENIKSKRMKISKEELEEIQNKFNEELKKKKTEKVRKPRIKKMKEEKIWLPKRIP